MSNASAERFEAHLKRTNEHAWLQRTGYYIHPKAMSYGHLSNTLTMIRRWGRYKKFECEMYCIAHLSADMGDGAYDAVESEARGLERTSAHQFCMGEVPIYRTMYEEFSRRAMG